mmetsp:Transcript_5685/g.21453  ORF Transcript_5685/g.21453 Transcript_5685/m.21453 type:complete len:319 (+) Transcript_5685:94-1050(+)
MSRLFEVNQHASLMQMLQTTFTIGLESLIVFSRARLPLVQSALHAEKLKPPNHHALYAYMAYRLYKIMASWFLLPSFGAAGASLATSAFFHPLNYISTRILVHQLTEGNARHTPLRHSQSLHETIRCVVRHELSINENYTTLVVLVSKVLIRFWVPRMCNNLLYSSLGFPLPPGARVTPTSFFQLRSSRPVMYYWIKYRAQCRILSLPLWSHFTSNAATLLLEEMSANESDLLISNDRLLDRPPSGSLDEAPSIDDKWKHRALIFIDCLSLVLQSTLVSLLCAPLSLLELHLHIHPEASVWSVVRSMWHNDMGALERG